MDTPLDKINWNTLTELYLENVELDQEVVDAILLESCPVLNRFEIKGCLGYYRLETESRNLHTLVVEDTEDEDLIPMDITLPCIQFLDISFYLDGRLLEIDVQSLYKARIDFKLHGWIDPAILNGEVKELLQYIHHVKELELKRKCFEVCFCFHHQLFFNIFLAYAFCFCFCNSYIRLYQSWQRLVCNFHNPGNAVWKYLLQGPIRTTYLALWLYWNLLPTLRFWSYKA